MYLNTILLKNVFETRLKNYEDIIFLNKGLLATTPDLPTKDNEVCYGDVVGDPAMEFGFNIDETEPIVERQLRNIYGRQGNIIGEEIVAQPPQTIGDLTALQDLRDHMVERRNPNPLTEEVEREVPLGHYLTNIDIENLEIEDDRDNDNPLHLDILP